MMFKMILLVFSILGFLDISGAQLILNGQCDPNIPLVQNFNVDQFLGTWHVVRRSENTGENLQCSSLEFTRETNRIRVNSRSVKQNFLEEITGTANFQDGSARLSLVSESTPSNSQDFWIINTEYSNFAIAYACENRGTTQKNVYLWQLGRAKTFPTAMMESLMNQTLYNLFGITNDELLEVDQSDATCRTLPDIPPGQDIILEGQCDTTMNVVQNFDIPRFLGVWHQISSYYTTNVLGTCPRAQYSLSGSAVSILNSQVINQQLATIEGTATVSSTDNSARLTVRLEVAPGVTSESPLWVLATDYTNYAVSYTCVNLPNNQRRVNSWILSRSRQLTAASQAAVNQVINSEFDLNERFYVQSDQSDRGCFYYPQPVAGESVTFRGQCDESLPVVTNFDAQRYMGLWHMIESYPAPFQVGTCNNAFYTLNAATVTVDVFNTQVLSQSLDTINGVARLATTDGTAKLIVNFPRPDGGSTASPYWVLDTDYSSYALVYSCTNINAEERRVTSWKLSRTKTLTSNAVTAINTAMNTVDVLDQRYFETKDQSREGCFYYPEPQLDKPVVFPGQCEDLQATPNFNFAQFQGTWYEVQAYPKDQQTGQCISHAFSAGAANTMGLQSSSITDQFLDVTTGTVASTTTDGSAKLTITIRSNNQDIVIPYWILDTDYSSYALAYSCVNLDQDFRAVYSWKLSRTKTLTAAANVAINNVVSRVTVLEDRYYQNIDQSDDACFFLPELAPGQPIILSGQCDSNIRGVSNFDATRYTGRWRMIESYPSDFQSGTCNDATYTLTTGGVVEVFNTQVIGQTLRTISGTATLATTDGTGKLLVNFPGTSEPAEYYILDTDYTSYSLVYSCRNVNSQQRRVWSWKLSRTNELSATAVTNMNRVINEIQVLNNRYYYEIDHSESGCFYYPENDGGYVIFRGQCNPNIPVVTNFNYQAYSGLWHNTHSYYSRFQSGMCNNAYYGVMTGGMTLTNTQVSSQTLGSISGVATPDINDGSARFTVSLSGRVDQPYWVLATDYTSYALVYSCRNLDAESYQVVAWKMSRTKQLSAAANTAINAVMNTIPVLDERYFITRDQSDEACFYYPVPVSGEPVVFPGQCDQTLQAVPNFNLAAFTGTWHEIQTYPTAFQPGQCKNHVYSTGTANTLDLVSNAVVSQILEVTNSRARFANAQDTSGKLIITIPSGTSTIEMPFWVLNTDYSDYALAYSCVNRDENTRAVYSWKLSRTKQLSAAGNTAINNRIATVNVLDQRYYENVDQSDNACFYLPDLGAGQPVVFNGQCETNIPVVQNFNPTAYTGRWRMVQSYPSDFQSGTCNDATYTLTTGGVVEVFNTQVVGQTLRTISGTATLATTDGSAKLLVNFPGTTEPAEYWILDTDYTSYSLVYSCRNINSQQRRVWSWKLSRTNELTANAVTNINRVISTVNVLNDRYYYNVDRSETGCFYYPENDGGYVIFRGQCNPNIPVVTNFNYQAYSGLWHNTHSYYSRFQSGMCNNAYYGVMTGGMTLTNTQVSSQTLGSISGVATPDINDGSARFTVSLSGRVDQPYWVLATDYTSYALVYSCTNLDAESYQVVAWKMSRTKQLSAAANTAINAVMNTIPVLDERYFITRDQSDEACFYYPVPVSGEPVVFPGQCDQTLQAVPNFNLAAFTGTWHEIQTYPTAFQPGQCKNHVYSTGTANTLDLVSNAVVSQILEVTNSRARFANAQDTSGKLIITIPSGTSTIEMPFWVLNTDYSDYALAYSCVNRDENTRAVYSWKLSRTKQLSAAGNTAINNRIATVNVLDQRYYENVDQSDNACFYLPDLGAGQPVVFNGQCETNIPVVQNFNAAAYTGRWRMIESYPSDFQSGTCNDATYTLTTGGVVEVFNTQVIGQTLRTINGTATLATTDGSAKLLVNFPSTTEPAEYWILATDYTSYSLVYSCRNINTQQRRVWSWKLSRTDTLTANAVTNINQVTSSINVLNERYYYTVDRSPGACFYYPDADGNPVTFRGQCDESIPVVMNFNAQAYMGTWYDIEGYPVRFQDGTCPSATYTLTTTGVDVFNTQVVAQQLDTIRGSAVLALTDGSAKLTVSFPIAGTELTTSTPYWVLATDYTNFALVYSCVNIDSENRRVSSWKLSRTKTLTAASQTAINAVINTVPVLSQNYFEVRGHSEEDCFFYPDNNGGPVILDGQCDFNNINVVNNFNASLFARNWYQNAAFPSELQGGTCTSFNFALNNNNIQATMTFVNNERQTTLTGPAVLSSDGRGIITVRLTNNAGVTFETTFYVLGFEDDFALLYGCRNVDTTRKQIYSWKLGTNQGSFSQASQTRMAQIIRNTRDLFEGYYDNSDQSVRGCFHYPVFPEPPASVELIGPCPTNIQAKANFNAANYLGKWFEIASYPQPWQSGQCSRAQYSLGNNVVNVLNTEVYNRNLRVQTGTAVVSSTDGSGILTVTFQLENGVTNVANYYVLETDYTSFALVYSCRNLDNGNRQVTSWKLSRSRTLPSQAVPIINNIVANTEGLLEEYYQTTSQTDEACFYIPEVNKDEAPSFRGQCETITGVQGFDAQRYLGWWHEIQSYPTNNDIGSCVSSDFQQVGSTYQVTDTNIFDTAAQTNTSSVTISNDGRLRKTYGNGQVVDIWVLATDYETYSLLYSCENLENDRRQVWSAKHSKGRQLTAAAEAAMAPVIQSVEVLEPQFYLPVNQSDSACFHYPEQMGDRVILPGQCDEAIPVLADFDPAQYSGTWYQIERYPQIHENGTCVGARYTLNEGTGIVTVLNWQVVDGVLDSVEGTASVNSTDGSAKLLVRLPIRHTQLPEPIMVEFNLYVLATDYTSYSLVYSCQNIDPFRRAVGVWKLSRTRTMATEGNNAINAVINTREELYQPYFISVEQNNECDEPSSALLVKSSIIIMLICSALQLLF